MKIYDCFKPLLLATLVTVTSSNAAAATLSLSPGSTSIGLGDQVAIDLQISDLGATEDLAAWNVDLAFDGSIFSVDSVSFGSGLGAPVDSTTDYILELSSINLDEFSDLLDFSAQSSAFTLATVLFNGDSLGAGAFTLQSPLFLNEAADEISLNPINGTNVSVVTAVPIPGAIWLLGSGVFGFMGYRRTKSFSSRELPASV